jgi:hypothetical protein
MSGRFADAELGFDLVERGERRTWRQRAVKDPEL